MKHFMRQMLLLSTALLMAGYVVAQPLVVPSPPRSEGQTDVLQLQTEPIDTVRIGFVGLGMRGVSAIERFCHIPNSRIVALCDAEQKGIDKSQIILDSQKQPRAYEYCGIEAYKKLCQRTDIDLVYICTDWNSHVEIALYAMEHGKHVAIEVPAATTISDIWKLVDTAERTRKHCMMLENCVYDFFEMATLNMAQKGLFGEVLHVEGAYIHNLDDYWDEYWNNWRLDFNRQNRGDIYPTHGLGPDCQVLNMHRGDRMDYLVAMDTKVVNGRKHVEKRTGKSCEDFKNGDQTSTLIRTINGKTILLQHNVMTPRPYNRMFQITGTDGYASKYPKIELLFREEKLSEEKLTDYDNLSAHSALPDSITEKMLHDYLPDFVKEIESKAREVGGHGGMDYIMDYRLIYCLHRGLPLDMDVYDMAEWCCISELSRISIENGSMPVLVPDFTRGAWQRIDGFRYAF